MLLPVVAVNGESGERFVITIVLALHLFRARKDSEGSNWIIKVLEEEDNRPLWISVWGGVNTLAQSLDKIKKTKSQKEAKRLISKLRVYTISDQDDSGLWIRNNFPDLFYLPSSV